MIRTGIENAGILARTAVRALLLKRIGCFIVKVILPRSVLLIRHGVHQLGNVVQFLETQGHSDRLLDLILRQQILSAQPILLDHLLRRQKIWRLPVDLYAVFVEPRTVLQHHSERVGPG